MLDRVVNLLAICMSLVKCLLKSFAFLNWIIFVPSYKNYIF